MELQINIKMDNAAFGENGETEAARILRRLAEDMEKYTLSYKDWVLMDANGNKVGTAEVIQD
jgi:hypothetical protein